MLLADHNAAYRWQNVVSGRDFAIQRNDLNDYRLVRIIRPANADAMTGFEVIAEGEQFGEAVNLLQCYGLPTQHQSGKV